jgi:hypothetical protein
MLRRSWSAAPALLVATCTLGNTDVRACDYGCDGGCGGYGYGAASYAYSPYPAYANYAPPLYYQPAYAYYAPPTFYTYAPPIYGPAYPAYYAPTAYGAPSYRPPYWRGPYAGPQYGSAPRIDRRTAVAVAAARPIRPHGRLSSGARPAPVTETKLPPGFAYVAPRPAPRQRPPMPPAPLTNTAPPTQVPQAKKPLGFGYITAQRGSGAKMVGATIAPKPATLFHVRRADAGLAR